MQNKVYPIGSIYLSGNDIFDPNVSIGGVWERITGRFLLGSGDNYSVGDIGGEAEHTLTIEEMPSHTHYMYKSNSSTSNIGTFSVAQTSTHYEWTAVTTRETGGGGAHNNMPPYEVVNIWKRIA